MQIRLLGELSLQEMKQALAEILGEIEDEYAVQRSVGCVLFINPSDEFGDRVKVRNRLGGEVTRVVRKGPYRSAADEYCP